MELTERERRVIADMERHFATDGTDPSSRPPRRRAPRRGGRPRWTVLPAAVLGVLLFAAGVVLDVGAAALVGAALVVWWLWPPLWRLLRAAGRIVVESFENAPPGPGL